MHHNTISALAQARIDVRANRRIERQKQEWVSLLWALCTEPGVGMPVPDLGNDRPEGLPILLGALSPDGLGKLIWKWNTRFKLLVTQFTIYDNM